MEEKRKLYWSLSGSVVKKHSDESDTFLPTACTEDGYLSNQGEFSVMKSTMNQTKDIQNGEKTDRFDGIRCENLEHKVYNTRHNSTSSITSTEN